MCNHCLHIQQRKTYDKSTVIKLNAEHQIRTKYISVLSVSPLRVEIITKLVNLLTFLRSYAFYGCQSARRQLSAWSLVAFLLFPPLLPTLLPTPRADGLTERASGIDVPSRLAARCDASTTINSSSDINQRLPQRNPEQPSTKPTTFEPATSSRS